MNIFKAALLRLIGSPNEEEPNRLKEISIADKKNITVTPGRVSGINSGSNSLIYSSASKDFKILTPDYDTGAVKTLRKLYKVNGDMGLVLFDLMTLTNTGFHIKFDESVDQKIQDKMRRHIKEVSKSWGDGVNGINGLVNKMIYQIWISGALSYEAEVNRKIDGLSNVCLINPEDIVWRIKGSRYYPMQKVGGYIKSKTQDYIKLNPNTYKYFALIGDEEVPYGIPPFLTALQAIKVKGEAVKSVNDVIKLMGLLGFLQVNVEKPEQKGDESDDQYVLRLSAFLDETLKNLSGSLSRGISVGYKDDHEYEFHSTSQNISGLDTLLTGVKVDTANGLKTHPSFMGIDAGKSETHLSIVFTKMLSQLSSVQALISSALEHIFILELALAGFKIDTLTVQFKPSTIQDDLKMQQANEIKIRNLNALYDQGIISQEQYADEMGYQAANEKEPRVSRDKPVMGDAEKKQTKEKKKDANDRKNRDKNKPQPKRKDTKSE